MTNFDEAALKELKKYKTAIDKKGGVEKMREFWMKTDAKKWFNSTNAEFKLPCLPGDTFNREELKDKIKKYKARSSKLSSTNIRELIVMIFAWGGMRLSSNNAKPAMATIDKYQGICRNLLENKLSPVAAYKQFFEAWNARGMQGIGPPYYTKLIYFLCQQEAAIMDQWAAKAVNVLSGEKLIKLNNKGYVLQKNNEEVYKKYLDFLGKIKIEFNMDNLSKTEQLIYSSPPNDTQGNVSPEDRAIFSTWRQYVIAKSG